MDRNETLLVLGEQAGGRLLAKKIKASNVASARLVEKRKNQLQGPDVLVFS
jgi:hypothetical protein